jgi:hypothetical protein
MLLPCRSAPKVPRLVKTVLARTTTVLCTFNFCHRESSNATYDVPSPLIDVFVPFLYGVHQGHESDRDNTWCWYVHPIRISFRCAGRSPVISIVREGILRDHLRGADFI